MYKQKKKIAILGGSGKLGQKIVSFIVNQNKYKVYLIGRKKVKTKSKETVAIKINFQSLKDTKQLKNILNNCDYIINCTGENINENRMYETNYILVKEILKLLKPKSNLHFIHFSTCAVFGASALTGQNNKSLFIEENRKVKPSNLYERTKYQAEQVIVSKKNPFFNYTIIRPSQILGSDMNNSSIKLLFFYLRYRLFHFIHTKESHWAFIFIDDLIILTDQCLNKKITRNKTILISNNIKLKNLVFLIKKSYKIPSKVFIIPIYIVKFLQFIFHFLPIKFPLSEKTIKSLTSQTIYISSKILLKLNLKKLKDINKSNIRTLLKK